MSLKRFNYKFQTLSSGNNKLITSVDSETQIHGLLNESIASIRKEVVTEYVEEIPTALSNITLLFTTCKSNSLVFWKAVEMIEKLIASIKHRPKVASKSGFMPILVDILLRADQKVDYVLELIEELTFVIRLSTFEPYVKKLVLFIINILTDTDSERNHKLQRLALSVLVNICGRNAEFSSLLNQEVNLVDLNKKIPIDHYGIMACKMNLVLHDCGHSRNEADILNFLSYTAKDLSRFRSLDEKTLKHLIGFLATITQRSYAKEAIQNFDFYASLEAAVLTLTTNGESSVLHINSLLEVMRIFLNANNNSLKKMLVTMLNFALPFLTDDACSTQVLETVNSIFNYDTKISTNSFELDDLCIALTDLIENNNTRSSYTTVALLKVVSTLAKRYSKVLYEKKWLRSMMSPLFQFAVPKFSKMHSADVSLYLQCLEAVATLAECQVKENDLSIFEEKNVRYLMGMSIKHGNAEQCKLALLLLNKTTSVDSIVNVITSESQSNNEFEEQEFVENNKSMYSDKENKPIGSERQRKIFQVIEKACTENTLNSTPATEFIDLYRNTISILENRNERLGQEVNSERQNTMRFESMALKWSELAKTLQEKIQLITSDKEKEQIILRRLRGELNEMLVTQKNTLKVLSDERKRSQDLEKRVKELEEEIVDAEALQANVLKLMSKRKKTSA